MKRHKKYMISFILISVILILSIFVYSKINHDKQDAKEVSLTQSEASISKKQKNSISPEKDSIQKTNHTQKVNNTQETSTIQKVNSIQETSSAQKINSIQEVNSTQKTHHTQKVNSTQKTSSAQKTNSIQEKDSTSNTKDTLITKDVDTKGLVKVSPKDKEQINDNTQYPQLTLKNDMLIDKHNKIYKSHQKIVIQQFNSGTFKVNPEDIQLSSQKKDNNYHITLKYPEYSITFDTTKEGYRWLKEQLN